MISNRHIKVIAIALAVLVTLGCLVAMFFSEPLIQRFGKSSYDMAYETALFDTSEVLDIAISMEEADWQEMLNNATSEVYYQCDVTINGKTFYSVGIRPKGNTSLSFVAMNANNDRYSFKLEFDQFVDGQTCYGLDKLVLNNNFADTTNMKEAILYDMYQALDADASLYNYAKISVNGQYWGVYLALEAVEDSFLFRNYGNGKGKLYKPEGMMGNRGGGANLNYTDDALTSYTTIWDGAVIDSDDTDHRRVVTALQNIHAGTDLAAYMDIDNVLNYMAVHNFAVNDDSLSGGMAHNYYLLEQDGRLSIIPWDYNLALGGMNGGAGTGIVNEPIDDSYQSTKFFDAVLQNETYLAQYHDRYAELLKVYFDSGRFEETYQRIRTQIDDLVKEDPNAMYSYDAYLKAADVLHDTIQLRAESVKGQLNGTIPSTTTAQRQDSSALIDASHINVSDMGSFMGGGDSPFGNMFGNMGAQPWGNQDGQMPNFELPEGFAMPEGMDGFPGMGQNGGQMRPSGNGNQQNVDKSNRPQMQMPEGMGGFPGMGPNQQTQPTNQIAEYISLAICMVVLLLAFMFVKFYKRKNY